MCSRQCCSITVQARRATRCRHAGAVGYSSAVVIGVRIAGLLYLRFGKTAPRKWCAAAAPPDVPCSVGMG
jgi:hypothetical protein